MGGAGVGNQTSYSALTGQFSYSLTFTASGLSLYDLQTHWSNSKLSFFSEPGFVYQPAGRARRRSTRCRRTSCPSSGRRSGR